MMPRNSKHASKFLSLVLRHKPELINITLDENGYIEIEKLLTALKAHGWTSFSKKDLDRVVLTNDKQRFAYDKEETKIRASQGHSVKVDLELEVCEPPLYLFHGTVSKYLTSIQKTGLEKRSRLHVHLSVDQETATKVGSRRGAPIVLKIASKKMHEDGFEFFKSQNGVWLTDNVPSKYIVGVNDD